jgi:F420-non-reducing hydrogenase iron-sulfur subunit
VAILKTIFKQLGLPEERVILRWISASEGKYFADSINEITAKVKELGPCEFKAQWDA